MTTDIYLDVDGVLNAVTLNPPTDAGWDEWQYAVVNGFGITYAPELIARMNALAERDDVTMHWLTTWEHDASNILASAIGLNGERWTVLGTEKHYSKELAGGWWKHHALVDYFPGRECRAVWIDDDISFDRAAQEWANQYADRLLLVSPSTYRGITRELMDGIDAFVAATQGAEA